MKEFIKQNTIVFPIILIGIVIVTSVSFSFYNRQVMAENMLLKYETEKIIQSGGVISESLSTLDKCLRGYAISKDPQQLHYYDQAVINIGPPFDSLVVLLKTQEIRFPKSKATIDSIIALNHIGRRKMGEYITITNQMVDYVNREKIDSFATIFKKDLGMVPWLSFVDLNTKLYKFENKLKEDSKESYNGAESRNTWVQIFFLVFGLPTLSWVIYKIYISWYDMRTLLKSLDENNRKYLFNPGTNIDIANVGNVISMSIDSFKNASGFVNQIGSGDYNIQWSGLTPENEYLNHQNLAGHLMVMRDLLQANKKEEEKRTWTSEGLALVSETVRDNQGEMQTLTYHSLTFIIKYLKALQGSIFVLREEGAEKYLVSTATYAFDRKKYISDRIEIGEGMTGQAFLEGKTVFLSEVPQNYHLISSGLGEKSPSCLLIVPLKYNGKTEAMLEIAGFIHYEAHQIAFVEKAGEIIASAIAEVRSNEKTEVLLEQFKLQTEQLKAQEEELLQNIEALEITERKWR